MKKKIILFFLWGSISWLSGCAGMNGDFSCPYKASGGCRPMSEVNQLASQGFYNNTQEKITTNKALLPSGYALAAPLPGEPIRYGETIQQVWIAPYEDVNGNYHEPSFVYTVLKKPHWIGVPEKEIQVEE